MKIALAQIDIMWENKEENARLCRSFIQKAKELKADLIAFPEMCLTGFSMNISVIGETIISERSFSLDFFRAEAKKNKINIGFGMVEDSKPAKNKYYVINEEGKILLDYIKIHPFSFGEEGKYFTGGERIESCHIGEVGISTFICYDLRFPEIFSEASKGSECIFVAANWPKSRREHFITLLKARAIENQCYIAGVNRVGEGNGQEYSGDSAIYDLDGQAVSEFYPVEGGHSNENGGEGLVVAEINVESVRKRRREFSTRNDRREDVYQSFYNEKKEQATE